MLVHKDTLRGLEALTTDDTRYYLSGIQVVSESPETTVSTATNGHALLRVTEKELPWFEVPENVPVQRGTGIVDLGPLQALVRGKTGIVPFTEYVGILPANGAPGKAVRVFGPEVTLPADDHRTFPRTDSIWPKRSDEDLVIGLGIDLLLEVLTAIKTSARKGRRDSRNLCIKLIVPKSASYDGKVLTSPVIVEAENSVADVKIDGLIMPMRW